MIALSWCDHIAYNVVTMTASVRQLKSQLSRYLKKAKAGEDVVITSRGKAIARLVPITEDEEELSLEEIDRRLATIPGIILSRRKGPMRLPKPIKFKRRGKSLSEIILEDRGPR